MNPMLLPIEEDAALEAEERDVALGRDDPLLTIVDATDDRRPAERDLDAGAAARHLSRFSSRAR